MKNNFNNTKCEIKTTSNFRKQLKKLVNKTKT